MKRLVTRLAVSLAACAIALPLPAAAFETSQWYGLIGPAGIPEAIVKRLTDEAAKAVRSKEVQEKFAADSAIGVGDTPAEFAAFIKQEQTRWERVVKAAGIKAD